MRTDAAVRPTMVPPVERLPDVLPTERLLASGKAVPELRTDLRRIADLRNAGSVVLAWAQVVGTIAVAVWLAHPLGYVAAVVLMGPAFARLAILSHEAAHKLLFTNKRINDVVGRWLLSYPAFVPFELYRRGHFAHHKDEFGPNEPDMNLYVGYPMSWRRLRGRLWRDASGQSAWKNLKALYRGLRMKATRPFASGIAKAQLALLVLFTLAGRLELYFVLWLVPWMTSWKVTNRLRAIAEHGGMERSPDRRRTTHHVRQSWLARFWMVPHNTGWHLAHHVDMGVPWRNLPRLHDELVAAGWITPDLEYPNYRSLWRALASGQSPSG